MYERFTDRARNVLQRATQEAQRFNHEYIGTEHVLLGLVKEETDGKGGLGIAASVLKNLDVDLRRIRIEVEKLIHSGPDMVTMGKLPQTPQVKRVLEGTFEIEKTELKTQSIDCIHLLLSLVKIKQGLAHDVLTNQLRLSYKEILNEAKNILGYIDAPDESEVVADSPSGVHFFIDPGSASAVEIGELYFEISKLYRLAGGQGVQFSVSDCRTMSYGGAL